MNLQVDVQDAPTRAITANDSVSRHARLLGFAVLTGICVAGFWNARVVDGFGSDIVANAAIGGAAGKASQFGALGAGFGFLFAIVAGLAATFTACNCVAFAMIPGLACARDARAGRTAALRSLGIMAFFVMLVGGIYGLFVGWLGPDGAAAFNARPIRFAQAGVVFSVLGVAMLVWAAIDLGLLGALTRRCSPVTRAFFAQPTTKAAIMGIMVGTFAVGRPYPVFREFLLYAAQMQRPSYGAAVMALQGLGQIAVMAAAFVLVLLLFGQRLARWVTTKPHQPVLVSAFALAAGGAYFLFYWGIARVWPELGRWGFKLGWYS
jgi:hypothetical protein